MDVPARLEAPAFEASAAVKLPLLTDCAIAASTLATGSMPLACAALSTLTVVAIVALEDCCSRRRRDAVQVEELKLFSSQPKPARTVARAAKRALSSSSSNSAHVIPSRITDIATPTRSPVGLGVGTDVGTRVGMKVGLGVGMIVGPWLGPGVGAGDGAGHSIV